MQLIIELDEADARAWHRAAAFRQQFRDDQGCILPDSESSRTGVILGEICRGWLESHGQLDWADDDDDT